MNYKKKFLNKILKYFIGMYNFSSIDFLSNSIYENMPFGKINSYLIIPQYYFINDCCNMHNYKHIYENFNFNDINNKDFIESITYNIWKYFDRISDAYSYSDGSLVSTVDIEDKIFRDKKDENNLNAKLFSIKEACEQERDNEYKVIKEDYVYMCSSYLAKEYGGVVLISKKFVYDELIKYIDDIINLNSKDNFNLEIFQIFLKKLKR